jgi:flagellar hook-associated protein 2
VSTNPVTSNTSSALGASTSAAPLFNIGGLASGLDTNSIISQLLSIERQPEVKLAQKQVVETARQNALRDVNTRLVNLQTAADAMRDVGTWAPTQSVSTTDPTNLSVVRTGGAAAGGYQVQVTQLARAHQVTQSSSLANATTDDTLHIQVGASTAVDVQIANGDSLQTISDKINSQNGMQVFASVVSGKLVLSGKVTGAANTISVTSDNGTAAALGFAQSLQARDAQYSIDGGPVQSSASNTVTSAIPGVSMTFTGVMAAAASVNVGAPEPDTSAIQAKIQAFVDQYNSTVDFIHSELTEQKVQNPQTNDDLGKGVLNGDPGLESLLTKLRQSIGDTFSTAPSDMNQLSIVGLSTGSAVGSGTLNQDSIEGLLTLDTDKLTTALTTRMSDVKALFTNVTGTYASEGLGQRMDDLLTPYVQTGGVLASRIDGETNTINDLKQQQADIETRVTLKETQLRAQFTAMETALAQSQSLSASISGQLASLSAVS